MNEVAEGLMATLINQTTKVTTYVKFSNFKKMFKSTILKN